MAITRHLFLLFTLLLFTGLSINAYAGPTIVPDVIDDTEAIAVAKIEEAGLVADVSEAINNDVEKGLVFEQTPIGGSEVDPDSTVAITVSLGKEQVKVPKVDGLNVTVAEGMIVAAGLKVGPEKRQSDLFVPKDDVISQNPVAGTLVDIGSLVSLVVSDGPAQVKVPDVVGDTKAAADDAIRGAELVPSFTEESSEDVAKGLVIRQSPAGGDLADIGSTVNVVLSSGSAPPEQVKVPDVVGDTKAAADDAIRGAELVPSFTEESSEDVAKGLVIRQSPAGGDLADIGSTVNVVLSSGSAPPEQVKVPDVVGDTKAAADDAIRGAELVPSFTEESSEDVAKGLVIRQSPAGGDLADIGSTVNVVLSSGSAPPEQVKVPDVVGDTKAAADDAIRGAELVPSFTEESSEDVAKGLVIRQSPAGGDLADVGSTVNAVISTGPAGGDNIVIDGCDTGVPDSDGLQDGIDQCEANAGNHGQFVRCVAIFTKDEGVPQNDRKGIMKCAAHSSIDGSGSAVPSEGGNVPDNNTGTPTPSSSVSSQSSVAVIQNVTIDGRDTGVGDSDGSIQASVDACAASAANHRKFVKCVGKVAKSLKRSGDISKREKKRIKKAAKKSSIGRS